MQGVTPVSQHHTFLQETFLVHFEALPSRRLSPFVERFLHVECSPEESRLYPQTDKLLPDGTASLIFNLGYPHRFFDNDNLSRYTMRRRCWLTGARSEPIVLGATSGTRIMGVVFRPGGLFPFLRTPASEVTGHILESEDLWGSWGECTCERLAETANIHARFAVLEKALLERAGNALHVERRIAAAVGLIDSNPGVTVTHISDTLGLTRRHLSRLFATHVGLSPKSLARLARFRLATRTIGSRDSVDWASLAQEAGYFDQSHLIADFREFAGLAPEAYLRKRTPFDGFVAV